MSIIIFKDNPLITPSLDPPMYNKSGIIPVGVHTHVINNN